MAFKNHSYRGPEVMIKLMRATNVPWQLRSIRNGYLISNAQYRERYRSGDLYGPIQADSMVDPATGAQLGGRDLRNLHSQTSRKTSNTGIEAPHSKYVSLTSSRQDTAWGEGSNPTLIFKFDIWRSDVWKGDHDITRDPILQAHIAGLAGRTPEAQEAFRREQTPADWDRGVEFEWLALGGTKVYNVKESRDGVTWTDSKPGAAGVDSWWESIDK